MSLLSQLDNDIKDAMRARAADRLLVLRGLKSAMKATAMEKGIADEAVDDAMAMAVRIVNGEGAWAWDPQSVDWSANEVEMRHEGETMRLDRLVRRREESVWWVLDYKSAARPERDDALLAQMQRYRRAVGAAYPGAKVMAAFLTGQGRLVVVD